MTILYLVSTGEYSDYRIIAAFSTKEKAARVAEVLRGEVEEYVLDPEEGFDYPEGMLFHRIYMDVDGETLNAYVEAPPSSAPVYLSCIESWKRGHNKLLFYCECWARDKEHAIKITNERRLMEKAKGHLDGTAEEWRAHKRMELGMKN